MVKLIKGDLLELAQQGKFDVIAHGCNCRGIMSSGIAGQIARTYPETSVTDRQHCREGIGKSPLNILGTNLVMHKSEWYERTFTIVNCYTQVNPGAEFNIHAFYLCMLKLTLFTPDKRIGIPQIGCGIGGGDWTEVKKVLDEVLKDRDITVVIYEPKKLRK